MTEISYQIAARWAQEDLEDIRRDAYEIMSILDMAPWNYEELSTAEIVSLIASYLRGEFDD